MEKKKILDGQSVAESVNATNMVASVKPDKVYNERLERDANRIQENRNKIRKLVPNDSKNEYEINKLLKANNYLFGGVKAMLLDDAFSYGKDFRVNKLEEYADKNIFDVVNQYEDWLFDNSILLDENCKDWWEVSRYEDGVITFKRTEV